MFTPAAERNRDGEAESKELLAKIGELTMQRVFLSRALKRRPSENAEACSTRSMTCRSGGSASC